MPHIRMTSLIAFASLVFGPVTAVSAESMAGPLVDAGWVAAHSCDEGVVALDIRGSARGFQRGRVPCSVHSSYFGDSWRVKHNGIPGMLPDSETLAALIGGLGISNDDHVVVIGDGGSPGATTAATRVYWTFKVSGHDAVSLLDGGFAAYRDAGQVPMEKGEAEARPATSFAVTLQNDLLATADDVAAASGAGVDVIDNRGSDYYVGINKAGIAKRAGTVPGADNVPINWLTSPDGRFQSQPVLDQIAAETSLSASDPQITLCNSGQMASLGWFVSHELLGNDNARLYDGSMAEWSADPARPVEQRIKAE